MCYATELDSARVIALRALLDIVNTHRRPRREAPRRHRHPPRPRAQANAAASAGERSLPGPPRVRLVRAALRPDQDPQRTHPTMAAEPGPGAAPARARRPPVGPPPGAPGARAPRAPARPTRRGPPRDLRHLYAGREAHRY